MDPEQEQREALDRVGQYVDAQVSRLCRLAGVGPGTAEACNIEAEFLQALAERFRGTVGGWTK